VCFCQRAKPIFLRRIQERRIRYYVAAATFHPFRAIIFPCLRSAKHPTIFLCHRPQKKGRFILQEYGKDWDRKLKRKRYEIGNIIESHNIRTICASLQALLHSRCVCESDRITLISQLRAYRKRLMKLAVKHIRFASMKFCLILWGDAQKTIWLINVYFNQYKLL